jgi:hypothetical protein
MIDMSIETAVFSGMSLIVLWDLVMLWIAVNSAQTRSTSR